MFAPGDKVGNYTILRKLGEGGMGEVYLAEHGRIARQAAIKVLRKDHSADDDIVSRFFNEARSASLIRHPGIVEILDCDVHSTGRAFIVMEYLDGEGLEACLARIGDLSGDIRTVIAILEQIADALDAAHAKGIVHRDLKPANIYLAHDSTGGGPLRVKILDFGIAKLVVAGSVSTTRTGSLLGTPLYMSPEQCRGSGHVDHRTDIYSLGCIAFELVTGRPPFVREGYGDLLIAHASEAPPQLSILNPALPVPLARLVMLMLSKSPDDRPQSMKDVVQGLRTLRSNDSVNSTIELSRPMRRSPYTQAPALGRAESAHDLRVSRAVQPRPMAGRETTLSNTASEIASVRPKAGARRMWAAGASMAVVLLAAAAVVLWSGSNSSKKGRRSTTVPVYAVVGQPDPPASARQLIPPKPSNVSIAVRSVPTGAQVWVDAEAEPRGVTPLTIVVERSSRAFDVRLALDGYFAKTVDVSAGQDGALDITLEKAGARASTRHRSQRSRPTDSEYRKLGD